MKRVLRAAPCLLPRHLRGFALGLRAWGFFFVSVNN